jgi:hypothetical protein
MPVASTHDGARQRNVGSAKSRPSHVINSKTAGGFNH